VILVFSLNDSQHVTDADYSVDTIQATITSIDISGIDKNTLVNGKLRIAA